jgi:nitrogen regulatory protein P-II 1
MKLIIAIIRRERLDAVQNELRAVLDEGDSYRITVHHVEGRGQQYREPEYFRGQPVQNRLIPKLHLTIAVNDQYVAPTIDAITKGARTDGPGAVGDGKIFVLPLEDCIRIRTGERGGKAI